MNVLQQLIAASDEYASSLVGGERESRETLLEFIKSAKAKAFLLEDNGSGKNRTIRLEVTGHNDLYLACSSKASAAINSGDLKVKDLLQFEVGSCVPATGTNAGKKIILLMMPANAGRRTGTEISSAKANLNLIVA